MLAIFVYANTVAVAVHDLVHHPWRNLEEEEVFAVLPRELACYLADATGFGEEPSDATSGRTYQGYLANFHDLMPNAQVKPNCSA